MQVTETHADPLKREFRIVIGAADLDSRLNSQLETMKDQVRVKGFRPGKVRFPISKRPMASRSWARWSSRRWRKAHARRSANGSAAAMEPSIELESAMEAVLDQGPILPSRWQ